MSYHKSSILHYCSLVAGLGRGNLLSGLHLSCSLSRRRNRMKEVGLCSMPAVRSSWQCLIHASIFYTRSQLLANKSVSTLMSQPLG